MSKEMAMTVSLLKITICVSVQWIKLEPLPPTKIYLRNPIKYVCFRFPGQIYTYGFHVSKFIIHNLFMVKGSQI